MVHYDIALVKQAAAGRWPEILSRSVGIPSDSLDGKHHPCPKCDGNDRFRLLDPEAGAVICNQCFSSGNGDGFAAMRHYGGLTFQAALQSVADYLGIAPEANGKPGSSSKGPKADPTEQLEWLHWSDVLVAIWCSKKPPIKPHAIQRVGGRLARYLGQYTVLALPVLGPNLTQSDPVGWVLYDVFGRKLPVFNRKDKSTTWVKCKTAYGSQPGLIGQLSAIEPASLIWKVEGPTDLLALLSLADLPDTVTAVTNANGAKEIQPWMAGVLNGKSVPVLHDADKPGQDGAVKWVNHLRSQTASTHNVRLPYDVSADHGRDLRDYLNEGHTYADLLRLADESAKQNQGPKPIEADDDPHRLARLNLEKYSDAADGGTLRYWRDEWYTWRKSRGCYRKIGEKELRAKVGHVVKEEFDRISVANQQAGEEDVKARKVTSALLTNILQATSGMVVVPSSVEQMTWLEGRGKGLRERRNYVALKNGILDLDAVMAGGGMECLLPHSADWFSTIRLPYDFNPDAECPRWLAFLNRNLEGDQERIRILQEWAGYCLLPDTGEQKFLMLEGEGANGKSVYLAGLSAMLGQENCSHIPLELFGDRFAKTQTLGKLVNISSDAGELDKVCEGFLKAFTSGDTMFFDRKGVSGLDVQPTARLLVACNNRPRFTDRSSGIWRRMLLIPWQIQIASDDPSRIRNMDKATWWEASGELPGIFLWALVGLDRLRNQHGFTTSKMLTEAIEDYQSESNPARAFLRECFCERNGERISTKVVYKIYSTWCVEHGYRPLNERHFGREVTRVYRGCEKIRTGSDGSRKYEYKNLSITAEMAEESKQLF